MNSREDLHHNLNEWPTGSESVNQELHAAIDRAFDLEAVKSEAEKMPYGNHSAHFDPTGGHGAGCPECQRLREARERLNEAIRTADKGKST